MRCVPGFSRSSSSPRSRGRCAQSHRLQRDREFAIARGYEFPAIRMEQEPGASGVAAIEDYRRRVLLDFDFKGIPSTGSKETRAHPVAVRAEAGELFMVPGSWNTELIDELCAFPQGSHDDQSRCALGCLLRPRRHSGSDRTRLPRPGRVLATEPVARTWDRLVDVAPVSCAPAKPRTSVFWGCGGRRARMRRACGPP